MLEKFTDRLRARAGVRRPDAREGERGQILVLFTLVIVVLLLAVGLVIDVGLLRTDAARLQNALDAGALAGAGSMPANSANVTAVRNTALQYVSDNYPFLPTPTTTFACLVGLDTNGLPRVSDMPGVCNVSFAANSSQWRCTATVCWAPCDPIANSTDVCNVLTLSGSATQPFYFGRVKGINQGTTGTKVSAACKGPCGLPPAAPVDAVLILDRTGSMDQSGSVQNLRTGAGFVMSAFNPELQRIALGFTGPTSLNFYDSDTSGQAGSSQPDMACDPTNGDHTNGDEVKAISLDPGRTVVGPVPTLGNFTTKVNTPNTGSPSILLDRPAGVQPGDLLLATVAVGGNPTLTAPTGWTQVDMVDSGTVSTTRVRLAVYRRTATSTEPANYTFSWTGNLNATGGVIAYRNVGASPIVDFDNANNTGTAAAAPSINAGENTAIAAFYGSRTNSTWTTSGAGALNEQVDVRNPSSTTTGPALEIATGNTDNATTGTKTSNATISGRWAAIIVTIRPTAGASDTYGTNVSTDLAQWIPLGFTGQDTTSPAVAYNEAYSDVNGVVQTNTHIYRAIHCFDVSGTGTNLARPLYMDVEYLRTHARPGVKQGIILETDGAPNSGGYGPASDYTNAGVLAAADAAKASNGGNIELFTIGYGVDNGTIALLNSMASGPAKGTTTCTNAENTDGDHFFCQPIGGDLSAVLHAAAVQLAGGTKLIQLYPQPVVTGVSPNNGASPAGGSVVTITGKYFTEAFAVTVGGAPARSFSVVSDTQINAVLPAGTPLSTVHIQVSTAGGSSNLVNADRVTYGP